VKLRRDFRFGGCGLWIGERDMGEIWERMKGMKETEENERTNDKNEIK